MGKVVESTVYFSSPAIPENGNRIIPKLKQNVRIAATASFLFMNVLLWGIIANANAFVIYTGKIVPVKVIAKQLAITIPSIYTNQKKRSKNEAQYDTKNSH